MTLGHYDLIVFIHCLFLLLTLCLSPTWTDNTPDRRDHLMDVGFVGYCRRGPVTDRRLRFSPVWGLRGRRWGGWCKKSKLNDKGKGLRTLPSNVVPEGWNEEKITYVNSDIVKGWFVPKTRRVLNSLVHQSDSKSIL